MVLFFVTFLSQFVTVDGSSPSVKMVFIGLYFIAFTLPCGRMMAMRTDRVVDLVGSRPATTPVIDQLFAGIIWLFGIKMPLAERN